MSGKKVAFHYYGKFKNGICIKGVTKKNVAKESNHIYNIDNIDNYDYSLSSDNQVLKVGKLNNNNVTKGIIVKRSKESEVEVIECKDKSLHVKTYKMPYCDTSWVVELDNKKDVKLDTGRIYTANGVYKLTKIDCKMIVGNGLHNEKKKIVLYQDGSKYEGEFKGDNADTSFIRGDAIKVDKQKGIRYKYFRENEKLAHGEIIFDCGNVFSGEFDKFGNPKLIKTKKNDTYIVFEVKDNEIRNINMIGWRTKTDKEKEYIINYNNKTWYIGSCDENFKPNGQGKYTYPNGDCYEGAWDRGDKHGQGKFTFANGDCYDGKWENGAMHGQGKFTFANGDCYEGAWINGKKNGQGKFTYANRDCYDGKWENDTMHGQGMMNYANGNSYKGAWKQGAMHGEGKFTYVNGNSYEGEWKQGAMHGKGQYKYADGNSYEGEWKQGAKHGKGQYKYADGNYWKGEWENGDKKGLFEYYGRDGSFKYIKVY